MTKIIPSLRASAHYHMDKDREIVQAHIDEPLLRWYDWQEPCVTIGLFSDAFIPSTSCEVARRPTGGSILFHGIDLAFSFFFPKSHPTYTLTVPDMCAYCNAIILDGLTLWLPQRHQVPVIYGSSLWCMASIAQQDLVWNGKKIGGGSFRRTRYGALYQVSLFIKPIHWDWITSVGGESALMQKISISLEEMIQQPLVRDEIKEAIEMSFLRREDGYV